MTDHERVAGFVGWLESQGIRLMKWRDDLTDTRPTDPDCPSPRLGTAARALCDPDHSTGIANGRAAYWRCHCKHWQDPERDADGHSGEQQGVCCRCGQGRTYEVTGIQAWTAPGRDLHQLLADWGNDHAN